MPKKEVFFHSLSKLTRELGATQNRDEMLDLIVTTAVKTMKAKAAVIFLMDTEEEDAIRNQAIAQVGLSDKYIHAGQSHAVKISPQLLKNGYMYFRDATTDKRLTNHAAKKAEGIGSILTVPVIDVGEMLGVLSLYTKEIQKFTSDQIDFLSILADLGAYAIKNATLIRKLRNNTQIFLKLAASVSASLDVKTILQAITEDLVKAMDLKAAAVRLLDEDKHTVKLVASFGLSEKYLKKGPLQADKNIAETLKGKIIAIKNVFQDEGIQYKKEKMEEGIVSMLYVPIKAQENVIGALNLYSAKQREFTEDEIMLVRAVAYQGGLAINNACLYLTMQDDINDLKKNIWSHKLWF